MKFGQQEETHHRFFEKHLISEVLVNNISIQDVQREQRAVKKMNSRISLQTLRPSSLKQNAVNLSRELAKSGNKTPAVEARTTLRLRQTNNNRYKSAQCSKSLAQRGFNTVQISSLL